MLSRRLRLPQLSYASRRGILLIQLGNAGWSGNPLTYISKGFPLQLICCKASRRGFVAFATLLGVRGKALGVSGDVPVVVVACPVKGWGEDGRIVWTLRTLGHPAAVFVDGAPGIKAKNDAGSNWDWSSADATEYPLVTGTN